MAEYIEREAAVKAFNNFDAGRADSPPFTLLTPEEFAEYLYELPAADVAPVVYGLWMPIRESEMTGWDPAVAGRDPIGGYICSACKEEAVYDCNDEFVLSKYCPNCGAKMDGGAGNG